ncbi:MAG: hypothetical protein ACREDR_17225 [Blastocatellia bacterium]
MKYRYRTSVLDQLAGHGIIPGDDTSPDFIHDFVNDLYVYEIRALKQRMISGLIAKSDYAKAVAALRDRYPILSLPLAYWLEADQPESMRGPSG